MTDTHTRVRDEFKALTYPHMNLLYSMAMRYCGNTFDAEDIVQETYLTAFDKFHQLREKDKCKPWLLKILRNNFLKTCQKNKLWQKLPETDYTDHLKTWMVQTDAESSLVRASDEVTVQQAIDRLPVKYREILALYYMDDLLYKDIADVLDIPIGTVMSRLTRAREGLKTLLMNRMGQTGEGSILDMNFNKSKVPVFDK